MTTTAHIYAYRIEAYSPGTGAWDLVKNEARGVEQYDGTAVELASEILANQLDDLRTLAPEDVYDGPYRVLVWEGTTEGDVNDAAIAEAHLDRQAEKPNKGGRPSTGRMITVRLPEEHIDALDELAIGRGTTRAEEIRRAVTQWLAAAGYPAENLGE